MTAASWMLTQHEIRPDPVDGLRQRIVDHLLNQETVASYEHYHGLEQRWTDWTGPTFR